MAGLTTVGRVGLDADPSLLAEALRSLPLGHHDHHRWLDYASRRMAV